MEDRAGVDAMVPPTPVRSVGATFPVMEHAVGGIVAVGGISAGLWGEPIAITKGTLELDEVLGRRGGEAVLIMLEPADPSRERKAGSCVELLERIASLILEGTKISVADTSNCFRSEDFAWSREFRIASAIISICGGVRLETARLLPGDSKSP